MLIFVVRVGCGRLVAHEGRLWLEEADQALEDADRTALNSYSILDRLTEVLEARDAQMGVNNARVPVNAGSETRRRSASF